MKPLYLTTPVREALGPCLRPGGSALTERILTLAAPGPASVILDAGCGTGASLILLRQKGLVRVLGLDLEPALLREASREGLPVARADVACLPLPDGCLDLVLCECVWNLTARRQLLREFFRTLRPGGYLAMSDIHARPGRTTGQTAPGSWPVRCCFAQALDLPAVTALVAAAGFTLDRLEDHSRLLSKTAADFVFAHGSLKEFWRAVTGSADQAAAACDAAAALRPGLFLLLARKTTR